MNNYDSKMMDIAVTIASMSKCVSHQVGCILVKDKRIISSGYNGTPAGYKNCCEVFDKNLIKDVDYRAKHSEWSSTYEIHAEMNAIMFAAKNGVSTDSTTLYCTLAPCLNCCKHLVQAGVKEVVYKAIYDRADINVVKDFLECNNVILRQL